jgi:P-type conjugative transfer protein TrbG
MMTKYRFYAVLASGFLLVSFVAHAAATYNDLEDAAVAEAQVWQSGGKARPIMSSDGKVVFAYGQSMPKLTCSPTRACDVEMQGGENVKKVILGDSVNWVWAGAESIEQGLTVQHVVFQPHDVSLESNAIITTDRRTYHIKLYSPKREGVYLNRVGFYYPQELVSAWEEKAATAAEVTAKDTRQNVMPNPVSIDKLDFEYRVEGNADFKPIRVFNDGGRVYMEMPPGILAEEAPILVLLDDDNKAMVVNYRVDNDPGTHKIHYVVDKLFAKGELRIGSEKVQIFWKKKEKSFFSNFGFAGAGR